MTTTTEAHELIRGWLVADGVNAIYGPARDLPTVDGLIAQTAVLWPTPRLHAYTRASGDSSGGLDRLIITCVGATPLDALAVADAVEASIGGRRLSSKGGTLRQTAVTQPAPEPNSDPVRVSMAVEYTTTSKD